MSLVRKIATFASSPQGRRAIEQARTGLDTPQNRQRLTSAIDRARGGRAGGRPAAPPVDDRP